MRDASPHSVSRDAPWPSKCGSGLETKPCTTNPSQRLDARQPVSSRLFSTGARRSPSSNSSPRRLLEVLLRSSDHLSSYFSSYPRWHLKGKVFSLELPLHLFCVATSRVGRVARSARRVSPPRLWHAHLLRAETQDALSRFKGSPLLYCHGRLACQLSAYLLCIKSRLLS